MKKLLKTLAFLALSATVIATAVACDSEDNSDDVSTDVVDNAEVESEGPKQPAEEADKDVTAPVVEAVDPSEITIAEQVLLDKEGVKITVTGYEVDEWGDNLVKFLIENNSDKNIIVSDNTMIINDFVVIDGLYASVLAGKKSNESVSLTTEDFISAAGKFEMYIDVYEDETLEDIIVDEYVTFESSAVGAIDTDYVVEGTELYNKGGVKIVSTGLTYDEWFGYEVGVYVENNSDKTILIDATDMSVNGFMIYPLMIETLPAGKKAFTEISIYDSELEENGIEAIEEIEVEFEISDNETYDTIDETTVMVYKA